MQYQLHQLDRNQLEKNFLGQNFKLVEKDACLFIKKGCKDLWLYNILAVAYAKQKKFQLAEENFLKIIDLDPGGFDHYFNLANLYRENREYNKCIKFLLLALKIKPKNIKALVLLSGIYYKIKDYKNNLSCLNLILSIDPLNIDALANKSVLLISIGKFQEALDCFFEVLELIVNGNIKNNLLSDISACYIFLGDLVNAKRFNLLAAKRICHFTYF